MADTAADIVVDTTVAIAAGTADTTVTMATTAIMGTTVIMAIGATGIGVTDITTAIGVMDTGVTGTGATTVPTTVLTSEATGTFAKPHQAPQIINSGPANGTETAKKVTRPGEPHREPPVAFLISGKRLKENFEIFVTKPAFARLAGYQGTPHTTNSNTA